jgi:hypothetical protein
MAVARLELRPVKRAEIPLCETKKYTAQTNGFAMRETPDNTVVSGNISSIVRSPCQVILPQGYRLV